MRIRIPLAISVLAALVAAAIGAGGASGESRGRVQPGRS